MDGSLGFGRPVAFDAITAAQSAPGLSTRLAQALFRAEPARAPAAPRETVPAPPRPAPDLPRPANDRQRAAPESVGASRVCHLAWRAAAR